MIYPKEFENLVNSTPEELNKWGNLIGWGNPNAHILIIGKESAIPKDDEGMQGLKQYIREIASNSTQWKNNLCNNITQDRVVSIQFKGVEDIDSIYNPIYPYKGQINCVRRIHKDKDGYNSIIGERGTSSTWYYYQKLCDLIREQSLIKDKKIDFHRFVFTTELSVITAKYSKNVDKIERNKSIYNRTSFFKKDFFNRFSIIILAVGHYPKENDFNIESIFHTKWNGATCKVGRYWYNPHHSTTNTARLLIHTNQLSMVSDALIKEIADRCIEFKNSYKIEL